MNVKLVISLLLMQLLARASCKQCPPREDIYPCKCIDSGITTIDCRGGSWKEIHDAFGSLLGKTDLEVKLWNVSGDTMPSNLFRDTHVVSLLIDRCDLRDLSDTDGRPAFVDLVKSLKYLSVWDSIKGANQLKTLDLSHLKLLKVVSFDGNNISEVGNDWFANGPFGIKSLTVADCGLCKIGDTAFAPLVNLWSLTLSGNGLTSILRSMLPNPAPELNWWWLYDNNLTSLPNDIFSGMPSLDAVRLRGNSLRRIEETTWSSVWEQLDTLDIYNNPLECDSHMEWMFRFPVRQSTWLYGTCVSPESQKGVQLQNFIKVNRKSFD